MPVSSDANESSFLFYLPAYLLDMELQNFTVSACSNDILRQLSVDPLLHIICNEGYEITLSPSVHARCTRYLASACKIV